MEAALAAYPWDLIISDYSIPGFGGPAALELYQRNGLDLPFIMVSGVIGEALAVEMVKAGAHNYVMKNQLDRLVPAVRQELRAAQERRIRNHATATASYVASLVESCDDAIIGTALDGTVVSWNTGAEHMFGYTAAEMVGHSGAVLVPPYRPEDWSEMLTRIREGGRMESCETVRLRKDGTPMEVMLTVSSVKATDKQVIGVSMVVHDITRRKVEENDRLALIQELTAALAHLGGERVQARGRR